MDGNETGNATPGPGRGASGTVPAARGDAALTGTPARAVRANVSPARRRIRKAWKLWQAFGRSIRRLIRLDAPKTAIRDTGEHGISAEAVRRLTIMTRSWEGERLDCALPLFGHNTAGSRPPLIWAFNAGHAGPVFAGALGPEQPLIVFRSMAELMPRGDEKEQIVRAMAATYADAVEKLFPNGPYLVGGVCQGGRIAEFIARTLMERGRDVRLLYLVEYGLNAPYPGRVAHLFGRDSNVHNPYYAEADPAARYDRIYGAWALDIIPGAHATFFRDHTVGTTAAHVSRRIDEALASPPLVFDRAAAKARIEATDVPDSLTCGAEREIRVRIGNESGLSWRAGPYHDIELGSLWLDPKSGTPLEAGAAVPLVSDLEPGASLDMTLPVRAPSTPGERILCIELYAPGPGRFSKAGSKPFRKPVNVS